MTRPRSDEPDPKVGTTLASRYQIDELIGEGGHGKVYRGFDPELQRPVAIKLPNDRRLNTSNLLEEARKVARLRHPGIVTVYDVGQHEGEPFIVSDFVSGTTLCEAGPFTPIQAAGLIAEIAESLHAAHEQGFVHRDIKPANILIDQQGRPLLTDFGIATVSGETQAQVAGTLPYMAPEQLGDESVKGDPRTDIWSLGVVLYELLTGKLPFDDSSPAKLIDQIRTHVPLPPRGINSDISPALEAVVLKCLAKAPEERYETAQQLAHALRTVGRTRRPMRWMLLVVLILATTLVAVVVRQKWSSTPTAITISTAHLEGMNFDGQTRVITPLHSFAPCTLEAWVAFTGDPSTQYVVGSDVPNFFGIGFGVENNRPNVETIQGGFRVNNRILPAGEWTHLAVVYGSSETRLYISGELVSSGPPTEVPQQTTPFVVGNVGEQHRDMFFKGNIRSVRISDGERYTDTFDPKVELAPDSTAVLVYDFKQSSGDAIDDLSGQGNHGRREWSSEP
ncbi:MAG: protein kinase [Planctomycetaceae bacterium]|nr:protein kinase [Planctomycetaceae bacterium]MCB9951422.1 protein kinase [Planctomycetaceae bacterium]